MVKILNLLDQIGFIAEKDGTYVGSAYKEEHGKTRFEFKNHFLNCYVNIENIPILLFSIIYADIKLGTVIFLLHDYGVISFDFIEKYVEKVEKEIEEIS